MYKEKLLELHCTSVLAPLMIDFVEQKRALGFKFNGCVEIFNMFDQYCNKENMSERAISKELLERWEIKRLHESKRTQQGRASYVRALCRHMHNNGYQAPYVFHPEPQIEKTFVPYIFTKEELARLFDAADKTKEVSVSPLRHLVMPVLFRLIYTCGLRASEALRLKVADVDLAQGVASIYDAKGHNDRMVGISDSMLVCLRSYRSNPMVSSSSSEYFFPSQDGGFYDVSTIYAYFRECLFTAGIPHRGRGKGPRIHDLRHTFAVHILNKWNEEGKDLYTCLPILRVYLGHHKITVTEKYLRLIPAAYHNITDPFNDRFCNITKDLNNEK